MPGLRRCARAFSLVAIGGASLVGLPGLLTAVASLVASPRLWGAGASVAAAQGLSC